MIVQSMAKNDIKDKLQHNILNLIKNETPLIDFPLLEYSAEEIYKAIFDLKAKDMIEVIFNINDDSEGSFMEFKITDKGLEYLLSKESY